MGFIKPLLSTVLSINLDNFFSERNISRKNFGNTRIRARGRWVRSENAMCFAAPLAPFKWSPLPEGSKRCEVWARARCTRLSSRRLSAPKGPTSDLEKCKGLSCVSDSSYVSYSTGCRGKVVDRRGPDQSEGRGLESYCWQKIFSCEISV